MTANELRDLTAAWRDAQAREITLRPGRDAAIRAALADGMAQRTVALAVGVSAGRVGQLALSRAG